MRPGSTRAADWWAFGPYAIVAVVHVTALAVGNDALASPTKLALMPLLALAVVLRWPRNRPWRTTATLTLTLIALGFSWLGDGAGTFFPFAPTLPMMLACFGIAHLAYIALFWTRLARRPVPRWAAVFALWWLVLLVVLWPHLGGLAFAVAGYGLVLGGTAVAATRCGATITVGALAFLTSDTLLAFAIFLPQALPAWGGAAVMATYTLGQGLLGYGIVRRLRAGA